MSSIFLCSKCHKYIVYTDNLPFRKDSVQDSIFQSHNEACSRPKLPKKTCASCGETFQPETFTETQDDSCDRCQFAEACSSVP